MYGPWGRKINHVLTWETRKGCNSPIYDFGSWPVNPVLGNSPKAFDFCTMEPIQGFKCVGIFWCTDLCTQNDNNNVKLESPFSSGETSFQDCIASLVNTISDVWREVYTHFVFILICYLVLACFLNREVLACMMPSVPSVGQDDCTPR